MPRPVYSSFNPEEQQKPADEGIQTLIDSLKDQVLEKTGPASEMKAIHYYTRVHGGPIHYIKVSLGEKRYAHVTLNMPMYNKPGPPKLADVRLDKGENDAVEAFGLHFD